MAWHGPPAVGSIFVRVGLSLEADVRFVTEDVEDAAGVAVAGGDRGGFALRWSTAPAGTISRSFAGCRTGSCATS